MKSTKGKIITSPHPEKEKEKLQVAWEETQRKWLKQIKENPPSSITLKGIECRYI